MKKITSIFSLALFSALTLSLSSCSDCDGGDGSCSGISAEVQAKLDELKTELERKADKVSALPELPPLSTFTLDPKTGEFLKAFDFFLNVLTINDFFSLSYNNIFIF